MTTEGADAKGVTLSGTDKGLLQLLFLVLGILILRIIEKQFLFLGIEIPVSLLQLGKTVDILFGFHPIGRIAEAPLLIRIQRLIYLIELVSATVFLRNSTFTHEDRISRRSIFSGDFTVADIGYGFGHIPVKCIDVLLPDPRTEHLQLYFGKLLFKLEEPGTFGFISRGRTFTNIRFIDRTFEFIGHVIPGSKQGNRFRETDILLVHADVNRTHGRARIPEISDLVAVIIFLEAGRGVILIGTTLEFLLIVYAPLCLRVIVQNNV